jgi:hypothetical protein
VVSGIESVRTRIAERFEPPARRATLWHILLIVAVSGAYESLFLQHGIAWLFDEGWPLYAAMRLHSGGVLYSDTFFLFPPGHLLPAWIAYALDPPGIILARILYAMFNVALCASIYLLGRKLMEPRFALLGALLVAVAAPRSHLAHLLFGYRYLVFSVLALLAFSERLRTGVARWMWVSGVFTGVALYFRLTPAFAVGAGIGIAVMSANRSWRRWLSDWGVYTLGVLTILAPVLGWFASGVGLEALWDQAVLRILPLQSMQSKPIPALALPTSWDRELVYRWFVSLQYWLYPVLYGAYTVWLAREWRRCIRSGRSFGQTLLLAVVIWGGVSMLRSIGRSDEHHLMSALPPVCLLLAHLLSIPFRRHEARRPPTACSPRSPAWIACFGALAAWVFLQGSDLYLAREKRGVHPLESAGGRVFIKNANEAARLDRTVKLIAKSTQPGDTVLDLTHGPLIHVLTDRMGPGYGDVVTPGVFADPVDEREFVERLEKAPPALVLWPPRPFDSMPSRSLEASSPLLARWVEQHYERAIRGNLRAIVLTPRRPPGD